MSATKTSRTAWVGIAISAVVGVVMLADAGVALLKPDLLSADMTATGFPPVLSPVIGTLALVSIVLYLVPRTAILGAILLTGFLGGAICTHLRIGEIGSPPQIVCLALGILAWAGLYLRDARLRAILPLS